jgi:outer membrane scaffolding protein for murein synthesis (MipA/OmpV family)
VQLHPKDAQGGLALLVALACLLPADVLAQQDPKPKTWDITLGAGAALLPSYQGSDRYYVAPVPLISATWRDTVALTTRGLDVYWHDRGLKVGGGLTYDGGRTQGSRFLFPGDERLNGLGDIPAALGVRAFASYDLGPVILNASLVKLTAPGNDGVLATAGLAAPVQLSERTKLTGSVSATWADQSYMQTYFGVTPTQSANSGYAPFQANSGIKDLSVGLGVSHHLDRHWILSADARALFLTGDAAASPITRSTVNAVLITGVAYHF